MNYITSKETVNGVANGLMDQVVSIAFDQDIDSKVRVNALVSILGIVLKCLQSETPVVIQGLTINKYLFMSTLVFNGALAISDHFRNIYLKVLNLVFQKSFDNCVIQLLQILKIKSQQQDASSAGICENLI